MPILLEAIGNETPVTIALLIFIVGVVANIAVNAGMQRAQTRFAKETIVELKEEIHDIKDAHAKKFDEVTDELKKIAVSSVGMATNIENMRDKQNGFIQKEEHLRLRDRVDRLEERVENLEGKG